MPVFVNASWLVARANRRSLDGDLVWERVGGEHGGESIGGLSLLTISIAARVYREYELGLV